MEQNAMLYTYLLSLLPSFEGRYAVVAGILMGLTPATSLTLSTLGVVTLSLTLPYLLAYLDRIGLWLSGSRVELLRRIGAIYTKYVSLIRRKAEPYVEKYGFLGLLVFVAIPLPGSGIWTGSLAAYLLGMPRLKTLLALLLGGILSIAIVFLPVLTTGYFK